ncbi:MAG: hypothetical protein Tsb0015_11210 [Simkaniaceae bacterium]
MKKNVIPLLGMAICSPNGDILLQKDQKWKDLYSLPLKPMIYGEEVEVSVRRAVWEMLGQKEVSILEQEFVIQSIENSQYAGLPPHFLLVAYLCRLPQRFPLPGQNYLWTEPKRALALPLTIETKKFLARYLERFDSFGRIGFEKQEILAKIGINPEEKKHPQTVLFSLTASYDMKQACQTDEITSAVDYVKLLSFCKKIAMAKQFHLLESLAHTFAEALFENFPLSQVAIRLEKPKALEEKNSFIEITKWN